MTNERLEQLKLRVSLANTLAGDIAALQDQKTMSDSSSLDYLLRCEVYRLGRELLLKQKEAELESLLADAQPERFVMDADIIGGFPGKSADCAGCGKSLILENAWMADGCPCNSLLGVNSMNETRWRLLMQLQQQQSRAVEAGHA